MNKFIASVVTLVAVGVGYLAFKPEPQQPPVQQPLGAYRVTSDHYAGGLYVGNADQFSISSTGAVTSTADFTTTGDITAATYNTGSVGSSSSSPAALGSAAAGHFVVAAGSTTANASTTAITANSSVMLTVEQTTPIVGTTCNTTIPTSTPVVSSKTVHSTNGGFQVTLANSPITNPLCLSYRIDN